MKGKEKLPPPAKEGVRRAVNLRFFFLIPNNGGVCPLTSLIF
jgi:hypothetical protein